KDMRVKIEKCENAEKVLDENDKKDILSFIEDVPHGVYSMMKEYPDIVECSNNLAIFEIKDDVLKVTISLRSSNPETFDAHTEDVSKVYEKYGFEVKKEDYYKPWAFAKDSELRNLALETYKDLFGKEMKVEVVHAALEPAVFIDTFPDMEMISIGPTMKDVHSPKERLSIESTQRTYEFVKSLLERL
ncbi:MAG: M20/M25/M40 family metallo-hydrolase, partial [Finegoldia magna]|nr:M20/M25/M40 family metallo-hydrolase [Finegoldia magna]